MTVPPREDTAEVVLDGQSVGSVYWSMNEEVLANVEIDESALPLLHEWAAVLGGEFSLDPTE